MDESSNVQVICDLDKTYIETEFESWVKMARIPFEKSYEKITVPGASDVLNLVRWSLRGGAQNAVGQTQPNCGLHFVSSSPPQLRSALEGKLILDDLDWTSDTFKNQTYNIRMARMDLLKHHIAYKTRAVLDVLVNSPKGSQIWMIGDNAEYDHYIYTGVSLALLGHLSRAGLCQWLASADVESSVVQQVIKGFGDEQWSKLTSHTLGGIFVRKVPGYKDWQPELFRPVTYFFRNWIEIAWIWFRSGLINHGELWPVLRLFHNRHGLSLESLEILLTDAIEELHQNEDNPALLSAAKIALHKIQGQRDSKISKSLPFKLASFESSQLSLDSIDLIQEARKWYLEIQRLKQQKNKG